MQGINLKLRQKAARTRRQGRARRSGPTGRRLGLVPWPSAAYGVESRRRGAALGVRPCSGPAGGAAAPRPRRSSRPTSKHLWEKARARGLGVWTRRRRRRARTRAARAERKREAQDASSARRRGTDVVGVRGTRLGVGPASARRDDHLLRITSGRQRVRPLGGAALPLVRGARYHYVEDDLARAAAVVRGG